MSEWMLTVISRHWSLWLAALYVLVVALLLRHRSRRLSDRIFSTGALLLSLALHLTIAISSVLFLQSDRHVTAQNERSQSAATTIGIRQVIFESAESPDEAVERSVEQPWNKLLTGDGGTFSRTSPKSVPELPLPARERPAPAEDRFLREVPLPSLNVPPFDDFPAPQSMLVQAAEHPSRRAVDLPPDLEPAPPAERTASEPPANRGSPRFSRSKRSLVGSGQQVDTTPEREPTTDTITTRPQFDIAALPVPGVPTSFPENSSRPKITLGDVDQSLAGPSPEIARERVLQGTVVDAVTQKPLAGVTVQIDRADREVLSVRTASDGTYRLKLQELPENSAVTITRNGYLPESRNLRSTMTRLDVSLLPVSRQAIVIENDPKVHHLGDDVYSGDPNSQFQQRTHGAVWSSRFVVDSSQLLAPQRPRFLTLIIKGLEFQVIVRINGVRVATPLASSPKDGSFQKIEVNIAPARVRPGVNEISIETEKRAGDLDDFEFVNPRIVQHSQAND